MHNHEPQNYKCPFCRIAGGIEDESVYTKKTDIVYQDEDVAAFIASHQLKNNPGTVIIIPNRHIENIYDLPDDLSAKIHQLEKKIALAVRAAYPFCEGSAIRLHNEPIAGAKCKGQDVFHYHLQIIPRHSADRMYEYAECSERILIGESERKKYADLLKNYFDVK